MKISRALAVSKKEYLHIIRDPVSLSLSFLMPALLLFLFGYAINFDLKDAKICVLDRDISPSSREIIRNFTNSGYFKVYSFLEDEKEIDEILDKGKAYLVLWIPENFSKNLKSGKMAEIQIIIDGSDSQTASLILNYVSGITENFYEKVSNEELKRIDLKIRFWYNQDLKSKNFIIPGLIALIIAIISALLSSLTISREWEKGTMEKLISTPLKPSEINLGKLIPYFGIGAIDLIFSVMAAILIFRVPFKGNFLFFALISSIYLFGGLSYGTLISSITRSQVLSIQISIVTTYLPTLLLSGFIFSIENMPKFIKALTYFFPARYFVFISRNVFLKGSPLNFLIFEGLLLLIFSSIFFFISIKKFKKEVF
ncbi:MAG: ABC transporter permease [Thermoanaerobaculia bacterium]